MLLHSLVEKRAILTKEGRNSSARDSSGRQSSKKKGGSKNAKVDGKGAVMYDIHGSPTLQKQVDDA